MTTEDSHLTKELYNIYENLVRSEGGLIITGYANIIKEEQPNRIYDESFINEYKRLTELVHRFEEVKKPQGKFNTLWLKHAIKRKLIQVHAWNINTILCF